MVKKKRSISETTTTVFIEEDATVTPAEEETDFAVINECLADIRKQEGVIGYILRNETSATIDLKENTKITNYALLTSQILDSSQKIAELFNIENVETIIVEGKNIKALCINNGENKISIFTEKNVDHNEILKKFMPKQPVL
jgi:predicted regulator of Ras-like GTPase activity (Roadblock/LC7/MglB family)